MGVPATQTHNVHPPTHRPPRSRALRELLLPWWLMVKSSTDLMQRISAGCVHLSSICSLSSSSVCTALSVIHTWKPEPLCNLSLSHPQEMFSTLVWEKHQLSKMWASPCLCSALVIHVSPSPPHQQYAKKYVVQSSLHCVRKIIASIIVPAPLHNP